MILAELESDPGQLRDEPAHPIPQRSICCDPTVLQEECIRRHSACHVLKTRPLWNEKNQDVLVSRQGRHIEVGERMPRVQLKSLTGSFFEAKKTTFHSYSAFIIQVSRPWHLTRTVPLIWTSRFPGHRKLSFYCFQFSPLGWVGLSLRCIEKWDRLGNYVPKRVRRNGFGRLD